MSTLLRLRARQLPPSRNIEEARQRALRTHRRFLRMVPHIMQHNQVLDTPVWDVRRLISDKFRAMRHVTDPRVADRLRTEAELAFGEYTVMYRDPCYFKEAMIPEPADNTLKVSAGTKFLEDFYSGQTVAE